MIRRSVAMLRLLWLCAFALHTSAQNNVITYFFAASDASCGNVLEFASVPPTPCTSDGDGSFSYSSCSGSNFVAYHCSDGACSSCNSSTVPIASCRQSSSAAPYASQQCLTSSPSGLNDGPLLVFYASADCSGSPSGYWSAKQDQCIRSRTGSFKLDSNNLNECTDTGCNSGCVAFPVGNNDCRSSPPRLRSGATGLGASYRRATSAAHVVAPAVLTLIVMAFLSIAL
eukprot:TRINITY_DN10028_c0_g1_i1.p1 TRINITY_DN10028_c0_g1~~TRINITY_DN10028_c0_g1_i1.p1  ORF type:complete len:228 (+),score=32.41 TRINITY_DN10028_c0_g1_i1:78-761(+)